MQRTSADELTARFESEVWAKVPHVEGGRVVNATPLVDITNALLECASTQYGLRLERKGVRVFAKFDSRIPGGSVKARPAARILMDAISSGKLSVGQTVFEATSGNFGVALGAVQKLGVDVVALVSRRLQRGVTDQLEADGVKLVNLDIEICPAPGLKVDQDVAVAKGVAASVRQQLEGLGFEPKEYDKVRRQAEELLARQDAIGLAKLLATAYGGFCTEQYDNSLNVDVHRTVTGPELDQQLHELGTSLGESDFVCAFGTGGTAGGVARHVASKHRRKGVRVVFPLTGQDVAGIRTKGNAMGLRFYEPELYLGEHEADFEDATRAFDFFNREGYDVGESGALALYAAMQLLNYGVGKEFVVMVADGSSKYLSEMKAVAKRGKRSQVSLDEAASAIDDYGGVVWAHGMFLPNKKGINVIASSLGVEDARVRVASVKDVQAILEGREPSGEFEELLPADDKPVLVVCIAGSTSLMLANELAKRGVAAESLIGGITGLPGSNGGQPLDLLVAGS